MASTDQLFNNRHSYREMAELTSYAEVDLVGALVGQEEVLHQEHFVQRDGLDPSEGRAQLHSFRVLNSWRRRAAVGGVTCAHVHLSQLECPLNTSLVHSHDDSATRSDGECAGSCFVYRKNCLARFQLEPTTRSVR